MRPRAIVVVLAATLLGIGTVLAFMTFDKASHSASDTLRPFLITMLPVWLVFSIVARRLLRRDVS
jgi:hypothetical protein